MLISYLAPGDINKCFHTLLHLIWLRVIFLFLMLRVLFLLMSLTRLWKEFLCCFSWKYKLSQGCLSVYYKNDLNVCCLLICFHLGWMNCFPSELAMAPASLYWRAKARYLSLWVPLICWSCSRLLLLVPCSVKLIPKVWEVTVWAEVALATSRTTHQVLYGFLSLESQEVVSKSREKKWSMYLTGFHPSGCEWEQQRKVFSEFIFSF